MRTPLALVAASLILAGSGCSSAKRTIQTEAMTVTAVAKDVRTDAQLIRDNAQDLLLIIPEQVAYPEDVPNAVQKVKTIVAAAERIDHAGERIGGSGAKIQEKLPGVEDTTPWWQTLLGMGFWGLVGVAIAIVLAWYGLLPIVIRALAGLASKVPSLFSVLIPDSIRTSAKLDVEAYDPNDPTMTAAIAARRQADPRYDAAYRQAKKEAKR